MNMARRGSTTKRNSKEGLRIQQPQSSKHTEKAFPHPIIAHKNCITPKKEADESLGKEGTQVGLDRKVPEQELNTKTATAKEVKVNPASNSNQPRKLSISYSDSNLIKVGRPEHAGNWFTPIITGSLDFSKTSLCLSSEQRNKPNQCFEKPLDIRIDHNRNNVLPTGSFYQKYNFQGIYIMILDCKRKSNRVLFYFHF